MNSDQWLETIKTGTWNDKELTAALASRDAEIDRLTKELQDETLAHSITAGKITKEDPELAVDSVECKTIVDDSRLTRDSVTAFRIR